MSTFGSKRLVVGALGVVVGDVDGPLVVERGALERWRVLIEEGACLGAERGLVR